MPLFFFLVMIAVTSCKNIPKQSTPPAVATDEKTNTNPYATIGDIPLPAGFTRIPADSASFTAWLRHLPLKKNKTVYTYNGLPKSNQSAQFAVIDISTGDKDLQQCADAVMRLRAEYLYQHKKFALIDFADNNHTHYRLQNGASRAAFDQYLLKVFSYCGTLSLNNQLVPVTDFKQIRAGDVMIKGGSPGHAMMVADIAINKEGKKLYLLAQSYMPAQDMHIVINPANNRLNPWYEANEATRIETPEWEFTKPCLKKWD